MLSASEPLQCSKSGVIAMPKPTLATIVLASVTVLSSTAVAGSSTVDPTYIGDRSANPEQETYGYVVTTRSERLLLGFVGPAENVGPVTGDAEKDTIGYRPLLGVHSGSSGGIFCRERW
jgi:hypothetical protein